MDTGRVRSAAKRPDRAIGTNSPSDEVLSLQRMIGNQAVGRLIGANGGGGQPLDPVLRAEMEGRFEQDFSGVRIHTGPTADAAASALNARAYTLGSSIVFRDGLYAGGTAVGKRLIAHELAHVVQQQNHATGDQRTGNAEAEASSVAADVAAGRSASVQLSAPASVPQCEKDDDQTEIKVIPDPGAGKLRVVRVDKQGRIVAGIAEITPHAGEPIDAAQVVASIDPESKKGAPKHRVTIPEKWQATTNPRAHPA